MADESPVLVGEFSEPPCGTRNRLYFREMDRLLAANQTEADVIAKIRMLRKQFHRQQTVFGHGADAMSGTREENRDDAKIRIRAMLDYCRVRRVYRRSSMLRAFITLSAG